MKTITRFPRNTLAAVLLAVAISGGVTTIYAGSQDGPAPQTQRGPGYGPGLDYGNGMMDGYGPVGGFGTGMMLMYGPDWRSYRDYTFNANSDEILRSDSHKAREVASYIDRNPSLTVGLDGSNERNVLAVRHALIMAGVPASKIQTGAYGDPQLRRDGRVAVLVSN
jgi:outer membrane protein OmpA-like peptidoglycan-associated protein